MHDLKVYTAGAMSCYGNSDYPKTWRGVVSDWFNRYTNNIKCIHPTDYYEIGKDYHKSEREVMRFDLRNVRLSDVLLVNLKDLDKSIGTCDEIFYAYIKGIPVIGFYEEGTEKDIHPWKIEEIDRIETGKDALLNSLKYIRDYYG